MMKLADKYRNWCPSERRYATRAKTARNFGAEGTAFAELSICFWSNRIDVVRNDLAEHQ